MTDGFLHCQVSDAGPVSKDDLGAPSRAVPWPAERGHGLWIVTQVADDSSINHGPVGTVITARFALASGQDGSRSEAGRPQAVTGD